MTSTLFHLFETAAKPVAPYSHAVEADGWVFLTGQIPNDPADDARPMPEGIEAQTRRTMEFEEDYEAMNAIYESYFPTDRRPARTCIGVTGLARGALVEIDFIAKRP
jgi:enamine deaminase RidA (YjgF/YER057c/UK114 family)